MAKLRFIVVGSGWRSLFYWRIAQALPERFELCAMLCRTEEKAEKMHREYGVPVSTSAEQCIALHPDLVVVAVNKASIAAVSTEWLARGFAVLSETPAALNEDALCALWQLHRQGAKLQIAAAALALAVGCRLQSSTGCTPRWQNGWRRCAAAHWARRSLPGCRWRTATTQSVWRGSS